MIRIGERLGDFLIRAEIGRGGMGTIYYATDTMLGREVALKVVHPQLADNQQLMERFKIEAMTQARLNHPHIVTLFSFNRIEDQYVIAMEYVSGRSLKELLQERRQLPPAEAIDLVLQVAEGLGYAHARSVIHRDIKPANILVDRDGQVKISDFGIAKILGAQGLTKTGMLIGTPWYTSPEQIIGKEVDFRSDLYSLGVTFYEMLTGRVPFDSETNSEFQIQKAHLETPPPRPSIFNPEIGVKLENFILQALQKKAEKRFQSARDMGQCLQRIRADLPGGAGAPAAGETQRIDGSCGRRRPARALRALAFLAFLGAAVAAIFFLSQGRGLREPAAPPSAGAESAAATSREAAAAGAAAVPEPATLQPDQKSAGSELPSQAPAAGAASDPELSAPPPAQEAAGSQAPAAAAAAESVPPAGTPGNWPSFAPSARPHEPPAGERLGSLDEELARLRSLLAGRRLDAADRLAGALLRANPESRALPFLGKVKFFAGHFAAAEEAWSRALQENLLVSLEVSHVHENGDECLGQLKFKSKLLLFNSDQRGDHSFALTGDGIRPPALAADGTIRVRGLAGGHEVSESILVAGRMRRPQKQKFLVEFLNRHVL